MTSAHARIQNSAAAIAAALLMAATAPAAHAAPAQVGQDDAARDVAVQPTGQVADGLLAWVGCWNGVGEATGTTVCFVPGEDGLERRMFRDSQPVETATLSLDRPGRISGEGCTGTETLTLSADSRRVYTETDVICGEKMERSNRGMMVMLSPARWLDVTSAVIAGHDAAWTATYEEASRARAEALVGHDPAEGRAMAVRSARVAAASARIYVDALIEATNRVGARGAEAWVAERGEPMRLDADALIRLADAGVPPSVIDVAVAVSFPDRFQVARADLDEDRGRRGIGYGMGDPWWDGGYWGRRSGYGYGYGSYYGYSRYDRFGYGSPYGYGYGPTYVVVTERETEPQGRWVKGRGYVRDTSPGSGSGSMTSTRPTTSSTGARSSGSSGTKRTAKPRGGGDDGGEGGELQN